MSNLEAKINKAEFKLIDVPPNPYLDFLKELALAESGAAIASGVITGTAALAMDVLGVDGVTRSSILTVIGPIAEKPMLSWKNLMKQYKIFKATAPEDRLPKRDYFMQAMRETIPIVRADLLGHDPAYVGSFALGNALFEPESALAVGALGAASFAIGLGIATVGEVQYVEMKKRLLQRSFENAGFQRESYFESKYLIEPQDESDTPDRLLKLMQKQFDLPIEYEGQYHDSYLEDSTVDEFNGTKAYFRLRKRENGDTPMHTAQLLLTRAGEITSDSIYKCFAIQKDKFHWAIPSNPVDGPFPTPVEKIEEKKVRKVVVKLEKSPSYKPINFFRRSVRDPNGLLISTDLPQGYQPGQPFWIEVKVREDLDLLREANDYICRSFPVHGTTLQKYELAA